MTDGEVIRGERIQVQHTVLLNTDLVWMLQLFGKKARELGIRMGINRNEQLNDYKSGKELIFLLTDIVARVETCYWISAPQGWSYSGNYAGTVSGNGKLAGS
jgi:hypothetical protein